jgi:scyllo-inositol 2-dehydrogenase (NADP+)
VRDLDGQESALRSGAQPNEVPDWGCEPEPQWGRLVTADESVPVPSERGDWPRFYALLLRALHDGDPPPVDPHDAVVTLRILEAARRSAANREVMTLSP